MPKIGGPRIHRPRIGVAGFVFGIFIACSASAPTRSAPTATPQNLSKPLQHHAYVWQRMYTPELSQALQQPQSTFTSWRVLAAQRAAESAPIAGNWITVAPDFKALAASKLNVVPVLRVPGSAANVLAQGLPTKVRSVISAWRRAGLSITRVEIDFDCAQSQLLGYRDALVSLRKSLEPGFLVDITALPSWLKSKDLPALLAAADRVTLQVHAVQAPVQGLFDARKAEYWIRSFDAISQKPFSVALPAYGAKLLLDASQRVIGVEHEADLDMAAASVANIESDPNAVQALLVSLQRTPLAHLQAIAWFRLPLPSDQRAWAMVTLQAVITGQKLQPSVQVQQLKNETGGLDVTVQSVGNVPGNTPQRIFVAAGCSGEGVGVYQFSAGAFSTRQSQSLRPGQGLVVGWLRCPPPPLEN
jgi:hypothetical protein